jgi:phosphatidylcholine synthase
MVNPAAKQPNRMRAWLVHTYTGTGAVLAFVAAWAVVHGDDRLALGALFIATLVDGTDGILARAARVKDALPDVDGARIDDIVDYMTFVLVPMLLLEAAGGLHPVHTFPVIAIVMLSSMYGFVAPDAKSSDHFFTGFPSYWNIVVLYLLLFQVSPGVNAIVLLVFSALVFVRIGYVYPTRTPTLRTLTLALGSVWALLIGAIIWLWPAPPSWMSIASLVFPVYYTVLSLVLHVRRRSATVTEARRPKATS